MGLFSWLFKKKSESELVQMQKAAIEDGWYAGKADDKENAAWKRAVIAFKRKHGLRPRYFIGPVTKEYILTGAPKKVDKPKAKEQPWIKIAKSYIGMKEIKGKLHNEKILGFWKYIGAGWFDTDEIAWCGAFTGYCIKKAGFPIPKGGVVGRARSFAESWPDSISIPAPVEGCIVVFWRGSRNGRSGHVGFCVGQDQKGRIMCLGGNQGDKVSIAPFNKDRVLQYRWPKGVAIPKTKLPILDGSAMRSSNNEA